MLEDFENTTHIPTETLLGLKDHLASFDRDNVTTRAADATWPIQLQVDKMLTGRGLVRKTNIFGEASKSNWIVYPENSGPVFKGRYTILALIF